MMNWQRVVSRYPKTIGGSCRNKYNARSCKCHEDHQHDSVDEADYCNTLQLLVKAKEIKSFDRQVTYDLKVKNQHITNHRVDFVVYKKGGKAVHEVKGFATPEWKLKYKLFQACYPKIPYIIIRKGREVWI